MGPPQNPLEHVVSSMGKMRDLDGTVDRCPPPPHELWPILFALRLKCEDEHMDVDSLFEEGGGNRFGIMLRPKFETTLKDHFGRFHITEDTMSRIREHYGIGYQDVRGYRESIAWKDFCEDVMDATDTTNGKAAELAAKNGSTLDVRSFR